jgi:hypothetical protein
MKPHARKTLADINRIFDAAGREQDFYRHLMRRYYRSPKGYQNFEQCAAGWAGELIACRLGSPTQSALRSLLCLDGLLQQAIPSVYYISPELIELVENTDVDPDLTSKDFNFFTQCALLLFPDKLFACEGVGGVSPDTYLTSFIFRQVELSYSLKLHPLKTPKNIAIRNLIERSHYYNLAGELIVDENENGNFYCLTAMDGNQETIHAIRSTAIGLSELLDARNDKIPARYLAALRVLNFVHRLAAIISTNPDDFIHTGSPLPDRSRGKGFGAKTDSQPWEPTWLGLKGDGSERVLGEGATGTGRSPRPHFRRGHLRRQRYGEGRALSKLVWIKPILVNAETT